MKWVLIIGGAFVVILLLMRRNEGGPTSGILGNSGTRGGGNIFDDIGSYVTSIKRLFGGSGSNSGRTGSELEKEDGSIDLSHIYG